MHLRRGNLRLFTLPPGAQHSPASPWVTFAKAHSGAGHRPPLPPPSSSWPLKRSSVPQDLLSPGTAFSVLLTPHKPSFSGQRNTIPWDRKTLPQVWKPRQSVQHPRSPRVDTGRSVITASCPLPLKAWWSSEQGDNSEKSLKVDIHVLVSTLLARCGSKLGHRKNQLHSLANHGVILWRPAVSVVLFSVSVICPELHLI